jgi:hypothetical protein
MDVEHVEYEYKIEFSYSHLYSGIYSVQLKRHIVKFNYINSSRVTKRIWSPRVGTYAGGV